MLGTNITGLSVNLYPLLVRRGQACGPCGYSASHTTLPTTTQPPPLGIHPLPSLGTADLLSPGLPSPLCPFLSL